MTPSHTPTVCVALGKPLPSLLLLSLPMENRTQTRDSQKELLALIVNDSMTLSFLSFFLFSLSSRMRTRKQMDQVLTILEAQNSSPSKKKWFCGSRFLKDEIHVAPTGSVAGDGFPRDTRPRVVCLLTSAACTADSCPHSEFLGGAIIVFLAWAGWVSAVPVSDPRMTCSTSTKPRNGAV